MENALSSRTKLRDWLNIENPKLTDEYLSSVLTKDIDNTPPSSSVGNQNQEVDKKGVQKEELIKYMSNLPSYLEKGDNLREKALSFGVLDWRRLEKWQHKYKQVYSPSSSNNSSFFSTDGSSAHTSRSQSCSPAKTAAEDVGEFQDFKPKSDKPFKGEPSIFRKYQSFSKLQSEINLKEYKKEETISISDTVHTMSLRNCGSSSQSMEKLKIQDSESARQMERLEEPSSAINHNYQERRKTEALDDDPESSHHPIKEPSSNVKISSESSQNLSCSIKLSVSTSRGKNLEDRSIEVSERSDPQVGTVESYKLRNPSPTRRFSIGLNKFRRRSSSLDSPDVPQLSSEHVPSLSQSKKDVDSCLENSSYENPNGRRRSQSSPLRRLLDPLLRTRAMNSNHSEETSSCRLDLRSCAKIDVVDLNQNEKHKSTVQALLQLSMKNGLPLLTFADDKNSGILAATVRKVCASKKEQSSWIYTFFNVDEVKKKSGWVNKGSKGKSHGYVPNIVAQMRVYNCELFMREFVLFPMELSESDQPSSVLRPNDELAAIVVKFLKEIPSISNKDEKGGVFCTDSSHVSPQKNEENKFRINSQDLFSTTVILPGGSHGFSSKGEPSPLIKRWKSGGLCDCGGWDLGCRIRVLTSCDEIDRRSSFSKVRKVAGRFELFSQGEVDDRPVFSLSPFKDNVFSVEFDSSLSFLQSFSICIAILTSSRTCDLSEFSQLFEGKSETKLVVDDGTKAPNPPLSPVGRV